MGESVRVAQRKRDILEFITKYRERNGVSPSRDELAAQFKYSSGSLTTHYLDPMINEGWLKRIPNTARGIVPVRNWWEYPVEGENVSA